MKESPIFISKNLRHSIIFIYDNANGDRTHSLREYC